MQFQLALPFVFFNINMHFCFCIECLDGSVLLRINIQVLFNILSHVLFLSIDIACNLNHRL